MGDRGGQEEEDGEELDVLGKEMWSGGDERGKEIGMREEKGERKKERWR